MQHHDLRQANEVSIKKDTFCQPTKAIETDSWVEVDKKAIEHNILSYKNIISPAHLAVVIKSNAYGHGMLLVGKLCEQNPHVSYLCTINVAEALTLRAHGIKKPILVLSIATQKLHESVAAEVDLVLYDMDFAHELNYIGKQQGKVVHVHIKVDTGLSRMGVLFSQAEEFIVHVAQLPYVFIRGIFTHFADSENIDQTFTNLQLSRFSQLLASLDQRGITIPYRHTSCTASSTANAQSHFNLVRLGIGTYGLWPSLQNKQLTHIYHPSFSLKPALTWKTRIIQIKEIPAGSYVGYDRTHYSEHAAKLALIPVGYWDGYDRDFSNRAHVVINNHCAPVIGRIAMNITMVDITGISASLGDEVILLGNHSKVTADELAAHCGTINYEIVTRINPLLERIAVE